MGWKTGRIVPYYSPAVTGSGVSEDFFKQMMREMQGQMPGMPALVVRLRAAVMACRAYRRNKSGRLLEFSGSTPRTPGNATYMATHEWELCGSRLQELIPVLHKNIPP
jgi:hypothetical protein